MKYLLVIGLLLLIGKQAQCAEIILNGYYYGTNLFIQNPKIGKNQYCITHISINGRTISPIPVNSSFDIDMSFLADTSPVEIRIQHHSECTPKVLNEDVIKKREAFGFTSLDIGQDYIKWQAKGERIYGKYFIRRFEKNNWLAIHALSCTGEEGTQEYEYKLKHFSGKNKYQIKYLDSSGNAFISDTLVFDAVVQPVTFSPVNVRQLIRLSRKTQYRVLDISGKVLLQGFADSVNCIDLGGGVYYLAIEDQIQQFKKK
ncbi:MAG: hypothetical protein AAGI07_19080 [Bacteroidota bacterium]